MQGKCSLTTLEEECARRTCFAVREAMESLHHVMGLERIMKMFAELKRKYRSGSK